MFNLELWKNAFTIRSSIIVHLQYMNARRKAIIFYLSIKCYKERGISLHIYYLNMASGNVVSDKSKM